MPLTKAQIATVIQGRNTLRQKCRTDLLFLCQNVLGYHDVNQKVHGPIIAALQKFPGGEDVEVKPGIWEYKPATELWKLLGSRKVLILYPRGHLKTTVVSQAHAIQWIINFPDIRILLSCATGDQIEKVVRAVEAQFRYNEYFRVLFPEFCPTKDKAADWGSKDQFITPARKLHRGEPTLFSVTVGKTIAGYHPDVIFHSDLVDKENVKTPGGIKDVNSHFHYMNPLLERYSAKDGFPASRGWVFVEGTPYDFGDLHSELSEKTEPYSQENPSGWVKVLESADPADRPSGKPLWPERFPVEELNAIQKEVGDWLYSAQYRMKCIPPTDGLCDPRDIAFIPAKVMKDLLPRLRLHVTIDLHGMEQGKDNDYTVLLLAGFDSDGRMYVPEIKMGRFTPEEVIAHVFDLYARYPQIIDFKVEKDAHARVLLPFLQREMSKKNRYPSVWPIPRDTHVSKKHRIRGLRPWFKTHIILFSEEIPPATRTELLMEASRFPSESSGVHDDILDCLADQMQNREGEINLDVCADPPRGQQFGEERPRDRFLGYEGGVARWLYGDEGPRETYDPTRMTGVL